ncbi:MAG: glycyl-tRNA synthetase beta chain [Candidatus Azotimanducaceae bacterium]
MTSENPQDLLIEIGTEELPPKNLKAMMESFRDNFSSALKDAQLKFDSIDAYATPRRLALKVNGLSPAQPTQNLEKRGPSLKAALDTDGNPTRAAQGFMSSCGIDDINQLEKVETEKGTWLVFRQARPGATLDALIQPLLQKALAALPIERRMRWGASREEFVRPVHWLVLLYGERILAARLFNIDAGRESRGHRFMSEGGITIASPERYKETLKEASVIADFSERRGLIAQQLQAIAETEKAKIEIDDALLDEVTALVEWPVALMGKFDPAFLAVPEEALISAMKEHQRYFHMTDDSGEMLARFITISNIESKNPQTVISGNERVILPRLSDARFFFEKDKKQSLESKLERLSSVVFQSELGSYRDKTQRLEILASFIADSLGANCAAAARAARLCKSDLVTDMVNEFPDLQGIMGGYYAIHDGESEIVASAIREHYLPSASGGTLPESLESKAVAIADKIDTLTGMFGIGQPPSGSRDPFALRRQTIGVVRMCVEGNLSIDLHSVIDKAIEVHGKTFDPTPVYEYLSERLKSWYQDQGVRFDSVDAVIKADNWQANLKRTNNTVMALEKFRVGDQADALITANKRVANILKKIDTTLDLTIQPELLQEPAEQSLLTAIEEVEVKLTSLEDDTGRLAALGGLREVIDNYFDQVMVMANDDAIRINRIATVTKMRSLFLQVADISLLQQ